jgi:hypothetical protein
MTAILPSPGDARARERSRRDELATSGVARDARRPFVHIVGLNRYDIRPDQGFKPIQRMSSAEPDAMARSAHPTMKLTPVGRRDGTMMQWSI